ncbi:unnamed protein product [Albugo candida]|uniref:Uncharacterized protein n=1 Tax=Albugo candida TaxID=65357 RepID=A0A024GFK2_9STRA|nr:unnamed protein product [Albugo candida]|eukprot:CCI45531.1 unnamed protein product [Albugo candida]
MTHRRAHSLFAKWTKIAIVKTPRYFLFRCVYQMLISRHFITEFVLVCDRNYPPEYVESHRSAAVSDEVSLMLASISAGIPFSIECSLSFPRSASSIAFAISLDVSVSACQCEAISGFERGY